MHRKFPSLLHPKEFGYAYDSSAMDHRATVEARFRMYQTYGDGLVQHSPDWSVNVEQLSDYLWSLADILATDEELMQSAGHLFESGADDKTIEFAAAIKYTDKPRHYNLRERKISANPKVPVSQAQHWKPIPDWADGSAKAIYGLVTPEYADGLMKFGYARSVYEWCFADNEKRPWMQDPARFLGWSEEGDWVRKLEGGYCTCKRACEAHRLTENVKQSLANHKEWIEREKKPAA